jgi:hypothetical protein
MEVYPNVKRIERKVVSKRELVVKRRGIYAKKKSNLTTSSQTDSSHSYQASSTALEWKINSEQNVASIVVEVYG